MSFEAYAPRVTDRELRDEIERLSAELRAARDELAASVSSAAGPNRVKDLGSKITAAKLERTALREQIESSRKLLVVQRRELADLKSQLGWAEQPGGPEEPWNFG
ncbi:MAG: hypothetical protein Q8L48_33030 [Archangium sp.]|nr:hypothetical protein [Archangium sp.]